MSIKITKAHGRRICGWAIIGWLLCWSPSCDWELRLLTIEENLRKRQDEQKKRDNEQDQRIEILASKIECDNPDVRSFILKCTSDEICDEGKVVNAIRNMKTKDHVMLRVPYHSDAPLEIKADDRRAQIFKLFRQHQILPGITKLLVVAIPSPEKNTKAAKGRSVQGPQQPAIDYTRVKNEALKLRTSLFVTEYSLPTTVKPLEPQVPRCDSRTENLVQIFHRDIPADQLLPNERAIQSPFVDLIIFLVEC